MDMMEIRRRMVQIMASGGAQVKTGTFTGNNSINVSLDIGFPPDVVVISSDQDYSQAGWAGIGHIVIAKGICSVAKRHPNDTATSPQLNVNGSQGTTGGDYGTSGTAGNYQAYATYTDGIFAVSNYSNGVGTRFTSGVTYTWFAVKIEGA